MKKHRLPVDIQFLLESILDESPDKIYMIPTKYGGTEETDPSRLNSLGAAVPKQGGQFRWRADNAYAFFFDVKSGVVMYTTQKTHTDMQNMLASASVKAVAYPATFKTMYDVSRDDFGNITVYSYKEKDWEDGATTVGFIGLKQKENDVETLKEYLRSNRVFFRQLNIRGDDDGATVPAGRIWIKHNVISFWNEMNETLKQFGLIEKLMNGLKVDKTKFAYEFLDTPGFYAFKELNKDSTREKLSPEEMKKLMAIQHLDPEAKEKLASPEFREKHLKKAAKGFDYAAKADAAAPALEGHIKLKDLIKENPDQVDLIGGGKGGKIAKYHDSDAVAFFSFPNFSAYYEGGTHTDIINVLYTVYGGIKNKINNYNSSIKIENDSFASVRDYMGRNDVYVTNFDGLIKDLQSGPLKDFFDNENIHDDDDPGGFRVKSGGLAGRLWKRKKIISFWNSREVVIKKWNLIEKLFGDSVNKFGKLNDYRVDWLERDISSIPLTPASEVSSISSSGDSQLNFLEKLTGDIAISPEELKKLQKKLHTMPAKEKKEALMKMGIRNKKSEELAAIAEKLGMTMAEFNHIMNVNEEKMTEKIKVKK